MCLSHILSAGNVSSNQIFKVTFLAAVRCTVFTVFILYKNELFILSVFWVVVCRKIHNKNNKETIKILHMLFHFNFYIDFNKWLRTDSSLWADVLYIFYLHFNCIVVRYLSTIYAFDITGQISATMVSWHLWFVIIQTKFFSLTNVHRKWRSACRVSALIWYTHRHKL